MGEDVRMLHDYEIVLESDGDSSSWTGTMAGEG